MPQTEGTLRGKPTPVGTRELTLSSPSFADGATIPKRHTADGDNVSPMLTWGEAPQGTRSFALTCSDPDAPSGLFVHWIAWNIDPTERSLIESVPAKSQATASSMSQGQNGFGDNGYGGPSPPPGKPHRYVFRLYALDTPLGLPEGAQLRDFERAISGHVLAEGSLVGKYGR